ncbi:MAG: HipA N-terminal domain-containing protein [Desulfovibrionaceae bacterium]|nr:HipA N-terminal domain-containing protein [Desulfovibrionaceae bacterium]
MRKTYSVCLGRTPCGTLGLERTRGASRAVFAYAADWLEGPMAFALGPDLPLERSAVTAASAAGLFGCFRDCTPDRWGRQLMQRREILRAAGEGRTPRTLQDADFFLEAGDAIRQGALRASPDGGETFLAADDRSFPQGVPPLTALPVLVRAVRRVQERCGSAEELLLVAAAGAALGGARPKVCVRGRNGELCIAKLSGIRDSRDMPLWEYVNLRLAARVGLNVPAAHLLRGARGQRPARAPL